MRKIEILDTTLRDGAQAEGIAFSIEDKLNIMRALDILGVDFIEAGNPFSNRKDAELFKRAEGYGFINSRPVAFGSTRRKNTSPEQDPGLKALLDSGCKRVSIFGKSWDLHVSDVLQTTLEENLAMIGQSVAFLTQNGREVFLDAEHYFDGYKSNKKYALQTLRAGIEAGARTIVLCDTNGGSLPWEIGEMVGQTLEALGDVEHLKLGIHCHNDTGCAVANSLSAVNAGAVHVQGTLLGYGERAGNANLAAIIANLRLKMGLECLPCANIADLTLIAGRVAEISNIAIPGGEPYIGRSAFAHKGGMHADGVIKNPMAFEHIDPEAVGNLRRVLLSEMSGRAAMIRKIKAIAPDIEDQSEPALRLMERLKRLEYEGYQFEAAEESFEMVIRRELGLYKSYYELLKYKTMGESGEGGHSSTAVIKVRVKNKANLFAAEGEGPVHALDNALRGALIPFFPVLKEVHLTDFKVRVLDSRSATAAKVRVLITSSDGGRSWTTVGVSSDIIEASLRALNDSIEYKLMREDTDRGQEKKAFGQTAKTPERPQLNI
jgi:2-isopropylmalate synthase